MVVRCPSDTHVAGSRGLAVFNREASRVLRLLPPLETITQATNKPAGAVDEAGYRDDTYGVPTPLRHAKAEALAARE